MVAHSRVAPQPVLDPERAVEDRIILLRGTELEPDPTEAGGGLQLGLGHVGVVVPEEAAVDRGVIGEDADGREAEPAQPPRNRGCGARCRRRRGRFRRARWHRRQPFPVLIPAATRKSAGSSRVSRDGREGRDDWQPDFGVRPQEAQRFGGCEGASRAPRGASETRFVFAFYCASLWQILCRFGFARFALVARTRCRPEDSPYLDHRRCAFRTPARRETRPNKRRGGRLGSLLGLGGAHRGATP